MVVEASAQLSYDLSQCLPAYYHRSEHVRTFFDSTQSQESKSEDCIQDFYSAMHIKTLLDNALYLSSLGLDLSM